MYSYMQFIFSAQFIGQKFSCKVNTEKAYQNLSTLFTKSPDTVPLIGACGREPGVEQVDIRLHPLSPAPNQLPNWWDK